MRKESLLMSGLSSSARSENVGFLSRIDFGSLGFRRGLLELAFEVFRQEKVRFVVLAGGLISYPALRPQLPRSAEEREIAIDDWAKDLAEAIPHLYDERGKPVKIYIVTSPAPNFDSWLGEDIARRLHNLRPDDIFYRGKEGARFPLKKQGKDFWVILPTRGAWRGQYFSTVSERLIDDKQKQSSQRLPDLWVTGCGASSIVRPKGEMKRPYISLPALHRLMEITTSENQIGVRVVEFFTGGSEPMIRTYSFKDFVSNENERAAIALPEGLPKTQVNILQELKVKGPVTIGMLEDALPPARAHIERTIGVINAGGFEPKIVQDEQSGLYQFDPKWFQNELRYSLPPKEDVREDTMVAFSCLHAGSVFTEYKFFVNAIPEFMLRHNVNILVGCGDFIEGLKHDLNLRGEVINGTNYTDHEALAARLVGTVIVKVFKERFTAELGKHSGRALSPAALTRILDKALLRFFYIDGNHDEWVVALGVQSLAIFRRDLIDFLMNNISAILHEKGVSAEVDFLRTLIENHVVKTKIFQLPSTGVCVEASHPHMGRATTSSLRTQEMLRKSRCHISQIGNFHIAIAVEQWDSELGQRVGMQHGSIVWKTGFEEGKTKLLDVVVGYLRVKTINQRIFMSEIMYYGSGVENPDLSKVDPLQGLLSELNI